MDEEEEENVDTEFTPDYYRLVKFESNPSLANSERGEPRPAADDVVPPDRQVALQTVLDFIAEQQRYCAQRQSQDEAKRSGLNSSTPPPSSSLLQLRQFVTTDDDDVDHRLDSDREDGSFSTTWMPVRGQVKLLLFKQSLVGVSLIRLNHVLTGRPGFPFKIIFFFFEQQQFV